MPTEQPFQPIETGDRLECVDASGVAAKSLAEGQTYTVTSGTDYAHGIIRLEGVESYQYAHRFRRPVEVATPTTYRVLVSDADGNVLDSIDVELESPAVGSPPVQARTVLAEAAVSLRHGLL